jgi:hypothetical protein
LLSSCSLESTGTRAIIEPWEQRPWVAEAANSQAVSSIKSQEGLLQVKGKKAILILIFKHSKITVSAKESKK